MPESNQIAPLGVGRAIPNKLMAGLAALALAGGLSLGGALPAGAVAGGIDNDGIVDAADKCPTKTPTNAATDASGCSLAPTHGAQATVNGVVGTPITPVVVPVQNPGKWTISNCTDTYGQLAAVGLRVDYDATNNVCVISGTPTKDVSGPAAVQFTATAVDSGNDQFFADSVVLSILPNNDADGDTVIDANDQCPGTPAGVEADDLGCPVHATVDDTPVTIMGKAGDYVEVLIPITNPGQRDILCFDDALRPAGLFASWIEGEGCLVFGELVAGDFDTVLEIQDVATGTNAGTGMHLVNFAISATPVAPVDQCSGTPDGAQVNDEGCSVFATVGDPKDVSTTVETDVDQIVIPVQNPGLHDVTCTLLDPDAMPAGLELLYEEGRGCVVKGTSKTPLDAQLLVLVMDAAPASEIGNDGPATMTLPVNVTFAAAPVADSDGDGLTDDVDQCDDTPTGAPTDNVGCSVFPTLGTVADVTGTVDSPITGQLVIPVDNLGKHTVTCSVFTPDPGYTQLPADLSIAYDAALGGCVISGTPKTAFDGDVVVEVFSTRPETDMDLSVVETDSQYRSVHVTIAPAPVDTDGDGMIAGDECPDTPAGADIDELGCSVAPTISQDTLDFVGTVGDKVEQVIAIDNPGEHTITCDPQPELAEHGLSVVYDPARGCVVSGVLANPTVKLGTLVSVTHETVEVNGYGSNALVPVTITVAAKPVGDDDNDGVLNDKDQCSNTPAGAAVDANGCSEWPTAVQSGPLAIRGEVGTPINPLFVDVQNTGLQNVRCQLSADLADAGLTVAYVPSATDPKAGACVVSGIPTKALVNPAAEVLVSGEWVEIPGNFTPAVQVVVDTTITEKPVVVTPDNDLYQPVYADTTVQQGATVVVAAPVDEKGQPFPADTVFSPEGAVPGWVSVQADGSITVAPGTQVSPGEYAIAVRVAYPDRTSEVVYAKVFVTAAPVVLDKDLYQPVYLTVVIEDGAAAIIPAPVDQSKVGMRVARLAVMPMTVANPGTGYPTGTTFAAAPGANHPAWATVNADGSIAINPPVGTAPGSYPIQVLVTYPDSSSEVITATAVVVPHVVQKAPVVAPMASQTVEVGTPIVPVTATSDDPKATCSATVPAGMTFDAATCTISGSPTAPGTYPIVVTFTNAAGSGSQTFVVIAKDTKAPSISPIADVTVPEDVAIEAIPVVVDDSSAKVIVAGLPTGVTYDATRREIVGTPADAGTRRVTVVAIDASGNTAQTEFTMTVTATPVPPKDTTAPVITRIDNVTVPEKVAIQPIDVKTDDATATVTVDGLPAGLSYTKGQITGTPTKPGTYLVTVTAVDAAGNTSTMPFVIVVTDTTAPVVTAIADQTITVGVAITPIPVVVDDAAAKVVVGGLPQGLSYNPATHQIEGTADAAGAFRVKVVAVDAAGNVTEKDFTITVKPASEPTPTPAPTPTPEAPAPSDTATPAPSDTATPAPAGTATDQPAGESSTSGQPNLAKTGGATPGGMALGLTGLLAGLAAVIGRRRK